MHDVSILRESLRESLRILKPGGRAIFTPIPATHLNIARKELEEMGAQIEKPADESANTLQTSLIFRKPIE